MLSRDYVFINVAAQFSDSVLETDMYYHKSFFKQNEGLVSCKSWVTKQLPSWCNLCHPASIPYLCETQVLHSSKSAALAVYKTCVSIICHNDELSSTMSWLFTNKFRFLFILFAENSQILLKTSVIPILLTFINAAFQIVLRKLCPFGVNCFML